MSLAARLTGVFAGPGEVFAEVKNSPSTSANWIAPLVIAMIAGIIYVMVVFSQPAVIQGMNEARDKQFQRQVAAGKMTQKQADAASDIAGDKFLRRSSSKSLASWEQFSGMP